MKSDDGDPILKNAHSPHTLLINSDNGPENNGQRTQWLKRWVEFAAHHQVDVQLACHPPYHSKCNSVERVFGVLENYRNGDPLTSVALGMAEGMTYKGVQPTTMLVDGEYPKGVKLDKKSMRPYEKCLDRLADLGKWFIKISSSTAAGMVMRNRPGTWLVLALSATPLLVRASVDEKITRERKTVPPKVESVL